jgi:hypothetical protein
MEHKRIEQSSSMVEGLVSCVIRFHNPAKLQELSLALMSLAGQTYEKIEPVVVLQDFSATEEDALRKLCAKIPWPDSFLDPVIVNLRGLGEGDHRAELATIGMKVRSGQFLCFLDYDDLIYGECYETLHKNLVYSGKVVACAGVVACDVEATPFGTYVLNKRRIFENRGKYEFFLEHQYPIHSFLIDTSKIDSNLLVFDKGHSKNEDYAFMLRILSKYDWDLSAINQILVEYNMRVDGSNTIMSHSEGDSAKWDSWLEAIKYVDDLKSNLKVTLQCNELISLVMQIRNNSNETQADHHEVELLNSHLNSLGRYLNLEELEITPHGHIDQLIKTDQGTIQADGWIAGPDSEPLDFVLIAEQKGPPNTKFLSTLCNIQRDDVASHLETKVTNTYGFHLQSNDVENLPSAPILVGGKAGGKLYRLNHGSSQVIRNRFTGLLGRIKSRTSNPNSF